MTKKQTCDIETGNIILTKIIKWGIVHIQRQHRINKCDMNCMKVQFDINIQPCEDRVQSFVKYGQWSWPKHWPVFMHAHWLIQGCDQGWSDSNPN